ncbi:glycosyltransferase family 2 protein [Mangrovimonas sp. YM274]|uniref:glycosyltransferase family 2 protein n=1 Tax=Mangrovimonas sp. YM274 TaxID=3070660 RepID=UPI0027DD9F23|nr:glycosyltransferase family A protein [Mangrovimonas sp. YM274]WMI69861.1 glycosyltransferase family A protein [Mangrovimonas sp. YM274]
MLFKFLNYLQPTHYFSLHKTGGTGVFPRVEVLPEVVKSQLEADTRFESELAQQYDLSWQALQKGYVGDAEVYSQTEALPLIDEYRFIRKYFNKAWVWYVLGLRLGSFCNPIKEVGAFWRSRHAIRSTYLNQPLAHEGWDGFESSLLEKGPKVSVVIPTLNRYPYLKDVLKDLAQQDYPNFEVLVVDQSQPFQESFYKDFGLDLQVVYQEEQALWLARNRAIQEAQGAYFLLFDDDSRVAPNWIASHMKALDFFKADISSGVSISKVGAKVPEHYAFFRVSDQLDTGNVLITREVFEAIGLFDRQFEKQRMGDGEFGLRSYLAGFLNVSNPYAERLHLKVDSGGLREMGSWDAFRTKKLLAPRPIPSVLYFFRRYFGNRAARYALLRTVPMSIMPYRFKQNRFMLVLGAFLSVLLLPLVGMQVWRSWRLASRKLEEGPMIGDLE